MTIQDKELRLLSPTQARISRRESFDCFYFILTHSITLRGCIHDAEAKRHNFCSASGREENSPLIRVFFSSRRSFVDLCWLHPVTRFCRLEQEGRVPQFFHYNINPRICWCVSWFIGHLCNSFAQICSMNRPIAEWRISHKVNFSESRLWLLWMLN